VHELSVASALIEQVLDIADKNQLERVAEIEVEAGALRQIVPELMLTAFAEVSRGTRAEGATLTLREIKAEARCRQCQGAFTPLIDNFLCPSCEAADVDILQGDEIILKSVSSGTRD